MSVTAEEPRSPIARAPADHVWVVPGGEIRYFSHRGAQPARFEAVCGFHDSVHFACRHKRRAVEGTRPATGRRLGLSLAWLASGLETYSGGDRGNEHLGFLYFSQEDRLAQRDMHTDDVANFFYNSLERERRPDEPKEPVRQP